MRGRDDKIRFVQAFNRLAMALKHRFKDEKERAAAQQVYFDSLESLSIDSVEAGERTLRIEGTSDNWFPTTPEWFDAAAEFEVKKLEGTPPVALLPPAPEVLEEELANAREARDAFIEECRTHGRDGLAEFIEAIPVRHPSEDPDAVVCKECGDSGMRAQGDGAGPCPCADTNPRIRAKVIKYQRLSRLLRRQQRTAALTPARSSQRGFSHV